jgi:hypothetical protein
VISEEEARRLECENAYLKDRCAQLEASVTELGAKLASLQAAAKRAKSARTGWHATLLSSGQ